MTPTLECSSEPVSSLSGRAGDAASAKPRDEGTGGPPLVAHVINHLRTGGLENGLVNLINAMPPERYRHAIVCLTDFSAFRDRIERPVPVIALHKRFGKDPGLYWRLWRTLRRLRPAIVHTRNLAALEMAVVAALGGVRSRVHGEHGRDVYDLEGRNPRYRLLRKLTRPFISRYTCVSRDLERWLVEEIGVPAGRVTQIYNGVDTGRFSPRGEGPCARDEIPGVTADTVVIGTVGRMQEVKDPLTLLRAFLLLLERDPALRGAVRLAMVGDGPLREAALEIVEREGAGDVVWLAGARDDVPALLRAFDLFVLPSIAEGISNTILEAMASGLPVVATAVGGNPELVEAGVTGTLVPSGDPEAMAAAIAALVADRRRRIEYGRAGRERAERSFSLAAMVERYVETYDSLVRS